MKLLKVKKAYFRAVTPRQIQALDKKAAEDFGVSALSLMENAGKAVYQEARRFLKSLPNSQYPKKHSKAVNIFCGKGNNGGDGFVAARYLIKKGIRARIFLFGKSSELKQDALINFMKLKKMRTEIFETLDLKSMGKFKKIFLDCDLIIDALFGVGLRGVLKEPFFSLINFLNQSGIPIFSVDVPSGLDATTGEVLGSAIKATQTITFTLPKIGFFKNEGSDYCGEIIVKEIGIPENLIRNEIYKHS